MREFSLPVLYFQLQKFKEIFSNDIAKGYLTYNFSIVSIGVKFLDIIDFEDYLVKTKIENDRLLHTIYKVSNDILELYIDSVDTINFKEREVIVKSLPHDWMTRLCNRAIAQVKAGFICLRVEEMKIRVYEEYYEIGGFNKIYAPNLDNHKNLISLINVIQAIRDLISEYFPTVKEEYLKKYYPSDSTKVDLISMQNKETYPHVFKRNGFEVFDYIMNNTINKGWGKYADISFYYRKLVEDGYIHVKSTPFKIWFNNTYDETLDKIKTINEVKSGIRIKEYSRVLEVFK